MLCCYIGALVNMRVFDDSSVMESSKDGNWNGVVIL